MGKLKGAVRRIHAAGRAMKGCYVLAEGEAASDNLSKKNRKTAARRAMHGVYKLDKYYKPAALLTPIEIKTDKVFDTLEQADAEAAADAKREKLKAIADDAVRWSRQAIGSDSDKTIGCIKADCCSGCGACFSACPQRAISMIYDAEGFLVPQIDRAKCTRCGLCRRICPSLNMKYINNDEPKCYAAYADTDIREKSSAGGIFTVMADYVLEQGGAVCGAGYTEDFKVEHCIIESAAELDKLRKSKYVQADSSKVYSDIKRLLENGRIVLFCGCGCQVAGLYAAVGDADTSRLYTVDLMCHGGPSPRLFDEYLDKYHGKSEGRLKYLSFRDKDYFGWSIDSTGVTAKYSDGTEYRKLGKHDPYYKAFSAGFSLRRICGQCPYAKVPRQGDITLADFWNVNQFNGNFNDGKGTSVVSINNEQGEKLYKAIDDRLRLSEEVPFDFVLNSGQPYGQSFPLQEGRKIYFEQLALGASMEKAYEYADELKYDAAIVGVWYGLNYGSIATYYGLHQLLHSFGLSVLMIDKPDVWPNDPEVAEGTFVRKFSNKHYNISRRYQLEELSELSEHADAFVLGSDQVWNRFINRPFGFEFYFDFVKDDKKKIAFAASYGHERDFCNAYDHEMVTDFLSKFDGIGVRETSAVDICKDTFGVEAVRVLDPVFAADKAEFERLADEAVKKKDGRYLLAYILDPTPEKREAVVQSAEKLGLDIVVILDGRPAKPNKNRQIMNMDDKIADGLSVEDWLNYFRRAEFVITDSCHGISFSLVFEKSFIGIANEGRGAARFESLVDLFEIRDHYVNNASQITDNDALLEPINYDRINQIMATERERSVKWFRDRLFEPKTYNSNRAYPVIDKRLKSKTETVSDGEK